VAGRPRHAWRIGITPAPFTTCVVKSAPLLQCLLTSLLCNLYRCDIVLKDDVDCNSMFLNLVVVMYLDYLCHGVTITPTHGCTIPVGIHYSKCSPLTMFTSD
jgi:hypothetical protein